MLQVRVPGSTSNIGAGFDCLGLALDLWLDARVVEGAGPSRYSGTLSTMGADADIVSHIVGGLIADDRHLEITSSIPVGKGLGSSAAATVAGIALHHALAGHSLEKDVLFASAVEHEGHPDNAAPAVYGGLVLVAGSPRQVTMHPSLGVALAIPDATVSTEAARELLPETLPRQTAVAQASGAGALLLGLATGDAELIRTGMIDHLGTPARRDLISGFDDATKAGLDAGAYGVTISGSGPTVLAISPVDSADRVAVAMAGAMTAAGNAAAAIAPSVAHTGVEVSEEG